MVEERQAPTLSQSDAQSADRRVADRAVVTWLMAGSDAHELPDLEDLLRRPQWMARAACRGEPIGTFFLRPGGTTERAQELCARCPVRAECLAHAMADSELEGVWAGTVAKGRARMRRTAG